MTGTEAGQVLDRRRLRLRAPAKVNLALHVTGRRPDGYHFLDSLVVFTELGDELRIEPAQSDLFEVVGPFASSVPIDDRNLVIRARDAFRAQEGKARPVSIRLVKNLPPASGIGGGSSDAAACLCGLAALFGTTGDLAAIGSPLGADIAMCLKAEPLRARGIGDVVESIAGFPALPLLLVNPRVEVPTPAIFKNLPSPDNPGLPPLSGASLLDWLRLTRNDLEAPAIRYAPVIADCLDSLGQAGAQLARMSGSGATCFGLFATSAEAAAAAEHVRRREPSWFVAASQCHPSNAFKRRIEP